jgi:uncharacterized iron-regulated membrane protein
MTQNAINDMLAGSGAFGLFCLAVLAFCLLMAAFFISVGVAWEKRRSKRQR